MHQVNCDINSWIEIKEGRVLARAEWGVGGGDGMWWAWVACDWRAQGVSVAGVRWVWYWCGCGCGFVLGGDVVWWWVVRVRGGG